MTAHNPTGGEINIPPGPCKHSSDVEFKSGDGIRCGECSWQGYVWATKQLSALQAENERLKREMEENELGNRAIINIHIMKIEKLESENARLREYLEEAMNTCDDRKQFFVAKWKKALSAGENKGKE